MTNVRVWNDPDQFGGKNHFNQPADSGWFFINFPEK
jgi:hypothetical protein